MYFHEPSKKENLMENFKGFECIERKTLQSKETQTYCTKNEKVFEAKYCKNEEVPINF